MKNKPVFLKLGGSLITDKDTEYTSDLKTIRRLAGEIKRASLEQPSLRLVLGHGSGSFGHMAAKKYNTRAGVKTREEWLGFIDVWKAARALNQIILDELLIAGVPVIAFPPSSSVLTHNGEVLSWDTSPLERALHAGLTPLVNGDVVFDDLLGGTILSTEEAFFHLAKIMRPGRILLAGLEEGVWEDYPNCCRLVGEINPRNINSLRKSLDGSASVDVTGGMLQKVVKMLELCGSLEGFEALIFSGKLEDNVYNVLLGRYAGTVIRG